MRLVVQQHYAQNAAMTREFDLNKPPTPPYRYQEFPRLLYREGKTAVAKDADELQDILSDGWSKTPPATMEVNLGGELSPEMRPRHRRSTRNCVSLPGKIYLRKIEALEARLESAPGSEPTEEQKRSKRFADAANAARARWEKRKQAPGLECSAVGSALPT